MHNGPIMGSLMKTSPSWIAEKGQEGPGCSHMREVVAGGQACTPLVQGCTHRVVSFLESVE